MCNYMWCTAQRKGQPLQPPCECYWLVNASPPNYRQWEGLNYGAIFRRLWTKVHQIMSQTRERSYSAMPFSDWRYLVAFRRHSRSKCEVVENRANRLHVFQPHFLLGKEAANFLSKFSCQCLDPSCRKLCYDSYTTVAKVISQNTLNFHAKFDFFILSKMLLESPKPIWGCVSKTWSFSTVCENLRWKRLLTAEQSFSEKVDFQSV